jgi:phosphatidylinositol dimannoside acyltransferase
MQVLRSIKLGQWLVRTFPAPLLRPLPYLFGLMTYALYGENRRMIIANQRQILGTASPVRLQWQTLRVMVNLFQSYELLVRLSLMTDDEIRQSVVFEGGEEMEAALARGRGAIILGAHIAGYNILAPFTALYRPPAGAFVEPVQPPELFEFVSQIRARTGLQLLLADREGAAGALRLLRQNGLLLIAADRYLGANGARTAFFGRPAYLPHGPIVLAQRNNTPILPATLRRLKDGRFLVHVHPPLVLVDTGNRRADLDANMRLMAAALERTIAGAAEQWQIFEPVWDLHPDGEPAVTPSMQHSLRPTGLRRWLAFAAVLLVIIRPFRRRQPRPPQDS